MNDYKSFLKTKFNYGYVDGFKDISIPNKLFEFQKKITEWACIKGRGAIFADTGLGKTFMQLVWADNVVKQTGKKVIIFAPLSVNEQTIEESHKININVSRYDTHNTTNIKICNYENLKKINPTDYVGIVLDESSILKSIDGKTRSALIEFAQGIQYRLACTATPAPNDISEIANHTEFLGIMKREEMLSKYFVNRQNKGTGWEVKGHAIDAFYKWMASWAMFIKYPSDLGFKDDGFRLPEMEIIGHYSKYEFKKQDELFNSKLKGLEDRIAIRKETMRLKAEKIAELVNKENKQSIIWCGLNDEAVILKSIIDESVNLQGSDKDESKIQKIKDFKSGKIRVLLTKPKIAGMGLNFQNCHNVHFIGLSDSYESYYQCIRRCYRFGQKEKVKVHIWLAGQETDILANVKRKERAAQGISSNVIKYICGYEQDELSATKHERDYYKMDGKKTNDYNVFLGDSCEKLKDIETNSVDFSVFSPPFAALYTYSPSDRDLGNCSDNKEFFIHFSFIIKELLRVVKIGRLVAVHCMNLPTKKARDGYIGLVDFRGDIIRAFQKERFIYHSEVCIQKNPQVAAIRTHAKGLMFKQLHKDSSDSRQGLADYICVFKKPGESEVPIKSDINNEEWIKFAHPIWTDIRETNTLNARVAKSEKDEKHMCPLQLDVIDRCIRLWSNRGETVLSPFMGIGSEGHQAIMLDRKFKGIELKEEYYKTAIQNLNSASSSKYDLFSNIKKT